MKHRIWYSRAPIQFGYSSCLKEKLIFDMFVETAFSTGKRSCVSKFIIREATAFLTFYAPTPQNGHTHSSNSSATADELL